MGCISRLNKGLVHLNLSHCGLTSKGVNQLAHSLYGANNIYSTLTYLNLSGNNLKDDIGVSFNSVFTFFTLFYYINCFCRIYIIYWATRMR